MTITVGSGTDDYLILLPAPLKTTKTTTTKNYKFTGCFTGGVMYDGNAAYFVSH